MKKYACIFSSIAILVLAACTRTPDTQEIELTLIARWAEDVATGSPRRPGELQFVDGTSASQRVATWAAGDVVEGDNQQAAYQPPEPLRRRRARWPQLVKALHDGQVLIDATRGLVGPAPGLPEETRAAATLLADEENHDRRLMDALITARFGAAGSWAEAYYAAVRNERLAHDRATGGREGRLLPSAMLEP